MNEALQESWDKTNQAVQDSIKEWLFEPIDPPKKTAEVTTADPPKFEEGDMVIIDCPEHEAHGREARVKTFFYQSATIQTYSVQYYDGGPAMTESYFRPDQLRPVGEEPEEAPLQVGELVMVDDGGVAGECPYAGETGRVTDIDSYGDGHWVQFPGESYPKRFSPEGLVRKYPPGTMVDLDLPLNEFPHHSTWSCEGWVVDPTGYAEFDLLVRMEAAPYHDEVPTYMLVKEDEVCGWIRPEDKL